ncbi:MAG: SUMF1/EgtB/PvdO family nonheme iron enzyme [Deltaproteobacteria bacterium]|nr:SUMF1/EgtB/PvdO family nonheme iron enzyme [Deltaproteobacteria bacterium]
MTETEQKGLILRERYELTVPERALIERGLLLAESLGKKEYLCPILNAKFVLISAGTFMMGSPEDEPKRLSNETLHQVTISKPFYMQTTEVTQGQWKKVMGNNPSYSGDDNLPVEKVSWNDVQKFIRKLNKMEGTNKYRLPTEAQWEYAYRAGSTTVYFFGNDPDRLDEYAWYGNNSGAKTQPVEQKKPNAWGLYDMQGNVMEWCQDWFDAYPSHSVTDPCGPPKGAYRVHRGGCWGSYASHCRAASRSLSAPDDRFRSGFRLLRSADHDRYEPDRRENLEAEQSKSTKKKKQIAKSKHQFIAKVRETLRDGDFIAYNNGTVLDMRTNLMWAAGDNGADINWRGAKKYCENYRGGGYSDWRMPTQDELVGIYDEIKENTHGACVTDLIEITKWFVWASETDDSDAAIFGFSVGLRFWLHQSIAYSGRALPVRSGK